LRNPVRKISTLKSWAPVRIYDSENGVALIAFRRFLPKKAFYAFLKKLESILSLLTWLKIHGELYKRSLIKTESCYSIHP